MAERSSSSPYVGPRPFEADEADLFFGREGEVRELLSHVVANRIVLCYAASGAGKTSLLNAGVIPQLEREEQFEILPTARFRRLTPDEAESGETLNVYVAATLLNWTSKTNGQPTPDSLKEFLKTRPRAKDSRGRRYPRGVFFDQFEELFTVYPEFWEQRTEFFEQLVEAVEDDPHLHVVLALREDYLAHLDPYLDLLPRVTRFRLERLGRDAALRATTGPLEDTRRCFAPKVADQLVADLRELRVDTGRGETVEVEGEFVEPVHLQVVCHNLWSALPSDVDVIDEHHLERFGDVDEVLSRYYSEAVVAAAAAAGIGEAELRRKLEEGFITPIGTRDSQFFGPTETARIPNAAIEELERQHLLRGEEKGLARRLELTHDRLIEPIRQSNESYRAAARRRRRRRLFAVAVAIAALGGAILASLLTFAAVDPEPRALNAVFRKQLRHEGVQVYSAGFSPDGTRIVTAGVDGTARLWAWESKPPRVIATLTPTDPQPLFDAAFSPDGRFVVTSGIGTARVWDTQETTGKAVVLVHPTLTQLPSASFSRDGRLVVTSSTDGTARVWDWTAKPGEPSILRPAGVGAPPLTSAAFSPNGALVVTASLDGTARVWDWRSADSALIQQSRNRQSLYDAAFSPDGRFVVTTSNGTARVRDTRETTGEDVVLVHPNSTQVSSAAFSPDGRLVVTASGDGTARVWDWTVSPGTPVVLRISRARDLDPALAVRVNPPLTSAAFSPDGRLVVTASLGGTVRIWDLYAPEAPTQTTT